MPHNEIAYRWLRLQQRSVAPIFALLNNLAQSRVTTAQFFHHVVEAYFLPDLKPWPCLRFQFVRIHDGLSCFAPKPSNSSVRLARLTRRDRKSTGRKRSTMCYYLRHSQSTQECCPKGRSHMNREHLIPTNLPGHFTFEPAPAGFDPRRASAADLERHGILHRPDPQKNPRAARHWLRAMSRVRRFITPHLTVRPGAGHVPALGLRVDSAIGGSSTNWSGLVIQDAPPYQQVWGTWTIPAVRVPPGKSGDAFDSAIWVGLGGFSDENLIQAGTWQNVGQDFAPVYSAFVQWFPGSSIGREPGGRARAFDLRLRGRSGRWQWRGHFRHSEHDHGRRHPNDDDPDTGLDFLWGSQSQPTSRTLHQQRRMDC